MADDKEDKESTTSWKWETVLKFLVTSAVAIAIAYFYLKFSWTIYQDFAVNKPAEGSDWDRAMVIYGTITSVGFAAIGVLLGTTVQQVNVGRAIEERDRAKEGLRNGIELAHENAGTSTGNKNGDKPKDLGGALKGLSGDDLAKVETHIRQFSADQEAKMREIRRTLLAGL